MRIALIEPYISVESLKSYAEKSEPSHLLGMYNLLKKAGYDVVLMDAYSNSLPAKKLVDWIEDENITHAGFTVYDYSPCISYVQHIFESLPDGIITIIGGNGPTYCTQRMINFLEPDWLVKGFGERAILDIVQSGFSEINLNSSHSKIGKTVVVDADPVKLDEILFERPYNLQIYDMQASPRIQSGCIGKCVFCSGFYQKEFDYINKDKSEQLLDYLVNQKFADIIAPNGSDLTAIPARANEFIKVLVDGNYKFSEFRPGVRLDTFSNAVKQNPILWHKLGTKYKIKLESSIESFSTERLNRLGKNMSQNFLDGIFDYLRNIFKICDCTLVLGRIAIDPTITISEFILDCTGFRKLLNEFNEKVTIGGMLMNQFVALPGTPSTEDVSNENPWTRDVLIDPAMKILQDDLLQNEQFKTWCRLAENISDFKERNFVFEEILRIAEVRAREVKSICTEQI